jgi:hypothetical protein
MIWTRFADEAPRIGIQEVRPLLPRSDEPAAVDVDIDVQVGPRVQRLRLESTRMPRRGGRRWWWLCPACGRRVGHLYLADELLCRRCSGLRYASEYIRDPVGVSSMSAP